VSSTTAVVQSIFTDMCAVLTSSKDGTMLLGELDPGL
jgi:hypothetical protein